MRRGIFGFRGVWRFGGSQKPEVFRRERNGRKHLFTKEDLKKLIVPLVIEQVLVMLVGMADTGMVTYAGEAAVSGVSLVDTFAFTLITVLAALATGGAVIVSQYLGDRDTAGANRAASQLQTITVVISVAIMVLCLAFHRQILRLFSGPSSRTSWRRPRYIC